MPIGAAALIPALIAGGSTVAGAAISSRGGGGSKSTSTTTPQLSPAQQQIEGLIGKLLGKYLNRGEKVLKSDRNEGRLQINKGYDAIGDRLGSRLTGSGFADSGKAGSQFKDLEIERANSMQQLEANLSQEAMQRLMTVLGLGSGFVRPTGSTTTTTSTGPSTLGPAVAGAGQSIATALWLSQILGGGGGGGTPSAGGGGFLDDGLMS